MAEYIDKSTLLRSFAPIYEHDRYTGLTFETAKQIIADHINSLPTIEAEPVKRGRWDTQILDGIMGNRPQAIFCDKCGQIAFAKTNYCPNCGARMDEVEDG